MADHEFHIKSVTVTGVDYGGMGSRVDRTLVCCCGKWSFPHHESFDRPTKSRWLALIHALNALGQGETFHLDPEVFKNP